MTQEDQRCSNSSASGGGGATGTRSSSKMPKNKQQPPKRGLGVAQLERIIYQQQQQQKKKKAAAAFAAPPHCFLLPLPQRPPIPFLFPSPADLPPTSSILSPPVGLLTRELPQLPPGWNPMGFYHDAAKEGWKFEPSNSIWPPPGAVIKKQDQQHQPPSSMVNIPKSLASSSRVNPQMEPPSNQIFYINSTRPWPEEDKVAGRKPLYPFSLEDHPVGVCSVPFLCKLSPPSSPCHRWDESLCGHDGSKFKYCNVRVREEGPGSKTIHAAFVEAIKENGSLYGRFLSLGLPATSSKSVPSTHHGEFNLRPFQGSMELQQEVPRQSQPFYNFLPTGPNSDFSETCAGRAVGADTDVDLNLKL